MIPRVGAKMKKLIWASMIIVISVNYAQAEWVTVAKDGTDNSAYNQVDTVSIESVSATEVIVRIKQIHSNTSSTITEQFDCNKKRYKIINGFDTLESGDNVYYPPNQVPTAYVEVKDGTMVNQTRNYVCRAEGKFK
jgi:hypothetical protein